MLHYSEKVSQLKRLFQGESNEGTAHEPTLDSISQVCYSPKESTACKSVSALTKDAAPCWAWPQMSTLCIQELTPEAPLSNTVNAFLQGGSG